MPDLELNGNSFDAFWMYASMAHPDNERYREELVAALVCRCILDSKNDEDSGDVEIPGSVLRTLLNAPSYENVIKRATNAADGGSVAGDVLLYVAEMHLTKHKEPSVRKAIYLAEDYLANAANGYGKKGASSDISIRKHWEKYKPVAHLWAAMRMLQLKENNPHAFEFGIMLTDGLELFLAIAEGFRNFGEKFVPSRPKNPESILARDKTWKVPSSYLLPDVYLSIQELPDWMIERLAKYSKRQY
jgi:hypothetical protein